MATNQQLESIAQLTLKTITLAHWDEKIYNQNWISACTTECGFIAQAKGVARVAGKQAQGMGLYLLEHPAQYAPKRGSDNLLIVTCTNTPFIDASRNPVKGTPLFAVYSKKEDVIAQEENGEPPKFLMKYGGYYRLTTVKGVQMTNNLRNLNSVKLNDWKEKLVRLSDRAGYNALKTQASDSGLSVTGW
jgi:hypothetical protein